MTLFFKSFTRKIKFILFTIKLIYSLIGSNINSLQLAGIWKHCPPWLPITYEALCALCHLSCCSFLTSALKPCAFIVPKLCPGSLHVSFPLNLKFWCGWFLLIIQTSAQVSLCSQVFTDHLPKSSLCQPPVYCFVSFSCSTHYFKLYWICATCLPLISSLECKLYESRNLDCTVIFHPYNAAAAKSLQSCPTLCDPIDSSPLGPTVPGILQARTLEWVAISSSNAWKWKVKVKVKSCPTLSDPMDCSPPGSSVHGIFRARVLEWSAIAFSHPYNRA